MTDKPDAKTVLEAHEHLVTSLRADPKHGGGVSWTEGVTIISLYDALAASEARVEAMEGTEIAATRLVKALLTDMGDTPASPLVALAFVNLRAALAAAPPEPPQGVG
jgi:hypothetical protein